MFTPTDVSLRFLFLGGLKLASSSSLTHLWPSQPFDVTRILPSNNHLTTMPFGALQAFKSPLVEENRKDP